MSQTSRYWVRSMIVAVCCLLILSACTAAPQPTTNPDTGGTGEPVVLRVGWAGSPDSINPGTAVLTEAYTIFELVYDSMFQLELDGTYTPDLAESYETSDDGRVWTFTIRSDAKWHDGEPLTAHDIAFSYNLYNSHEDFPYLNAYTLNFESIEAPDDTTLILTLTDPIPNLESQLVFLYVVPEHIWSEQDDATIAEFENAEMIGSGPFKLLSYAQNESVHLQATDEHYRYQPAIDEITFQTFESQDAMVQALRTAQVDMITEVPKATIPSLRNEDGITLVNGPALSPGVTDIIFNQVDPDTCASLEGVCSGHPALRDRNVRLALAHATDKQQMIDVVLLGLGEPGLTLIPSGLGPFYNDSIEDYAFDIEQANQILDDAGYADTDSDGVREMPDGSQPLTFRLNWPSDSLVAPRMAELLSDMWSQVGVSLQPQAVDPDALTAACCPTFDYDVMIWGWISDPDPNLLLSVMSTGQIESGYNETGYSNPEYDEINDAQTRELDLSTRQSMIWELQGIVHRDVVYIIPFYDQNVQAYRTDRFTGWIIDAGKLELTDISSISIIQPTP